MVNLKLFRKRLIAFYTSWIQHKEDLWGNSDVIVIYNPPADSPENQSHHISSHFYSWLLGRDFHDTILLFSRTAIYFVCPKKKVHLLQTLIVPAAESVDARVLIQGKNTGIFGFSLMDDMIRSLRLAMLERGEIRPIVIGCITGESPKLNLLWSGANQSKYRSASVETGMRKLLSHGDCVRVQMECLPDKFEEMLNMANESEGKMDDENKKVFGEKEKEKESGSMPRENCGTVSDEFDDDDDDDDDDWVVVGY